jgi:two-component system heavy metal sensor histidine kinase CusS
MLRNLSISRRIVLMIVVVSASIFTVCAMWLYFQMQRSFIEQIYTDLQFRHSVLDPMIVSSSNPEEWQAVRNKLVALDSKDTGTSYWVLSKDPTFTFGSGPANPNWLIQNEGFSVLENTEKKRTWVIFTRAIAANAERPAIRFVMATDCTPFFNTLAKLRQMLTLLTLLGTLSMALLGYVIVRVGLSPVRNLSEQANKLPPGNSTQRLATDNLPLELKKLANSFNGALARQETAWAQLENFNANVAHELRTPLTNMLGHTQVILSQQRSAQELENLLESNLEEIERMTGIVNDMLFLSYAQSGQRAADLSHVSLREEALKTIDYLEPVLAENNVDVTVEGDVAAQIDRRLFHRALANLLSNSARYTNNGKVAVALQAIGPYAQITVTNSGDAIDPDIAQHLFARFYRADQARTRSATHHGLGLSIVHAIANMHGGDVFITSDNGLNTFGFTMLLHP